MSRRNLVGVLARALHEAVCEDLLDGPVPFEGEPDRVRAEMVLLRLEDNGYAVEARQQGRDRRTAELESALVAITDPNGLCCCRNCACGFHSEARRALAEQGR